MSAENSKFISGLDLSELYYREAVEPILHDSFSGLTYAAALIGSGSEILGFDSQMSTDHHWGPRLMVFINDIKLEIHAQALSQTLSAKLPRRFQGFPTSYTASNPAENGVQLLDYSDEGPINHRVEITSCRKFIRDYLGFDLNNEISSADWLSFPDQKLLSITAGRVFHDEIGLEEVRTKFSYYPNDIWLYLLAAAWARIEQEEHLMGRAGSVGDEIGSAIIAARLVRDLMRLCFLMEKQYAPYPKWFGSAFKKLKAAPLLEPILMQALNASDWKERERHLADAYEFIADLHNQLAITKPMPNKTSQFHERPFYVISMGAFSKEISAAISDPAVCAIAKFPLIGSIDQLSDSTDLQSNTIWREALCKLYST